MPDLSLDEFAARAKAALDPTAEVPPAVQAVADRERAAAFTNTEGYTPAKDVDGRWAAMEFARRLSNVEIAARMRPFVGAAPAIMAKTSEFWKGVNRAGLHGGRSEAQQLVRDVRDYLTGFQVGPVAQVGDSPEILRQIYDKADEKFRNVVAANSWEDMTEEQGQQVFGAFLASEVITRTPLSVNQEREVGTLALDSIVEQRSQQLAAGFNPGAPDAVRIKIGQQLAALDQVKRMSGDAKSSYYRYLFFNRYALPENDEEREMAYVWTKKYRNAAAQIAAETGVKPSSLDDTLKLRDLLDDGFGGQRDVADQQFAQLYGQVADAYRLKDIGFFDGDITQAGVLIPDVAAPGGFTPLALVPHSTIEDIEKARQMREVVPLNVPEADLALREQARRSELAIGGPAAARKVLDDWEVMVAPQRAMTTMAIAAGYTEPPMATTPVEEAAVPASAKVAQAIFGTLEGIKDVGVSILEGVKKTVPMKELGRRLFYNFTGDEESVQEIDNVMQAISMLYSWQREFGRQNWRFGLELQGLAQAQPTLDDIDPHALDAVLTEMDASESPSVREAFQGLPGRTLFNEIAKNSSAVAAMHHNMAEAIEEQDRRNVELAKYQKTGEGGLGKYVSNVAKSTLFQIGQMVTDMGAEVMDNPERASLIWAGDKIGEFGMRLGYAGISYPIARAMRTVTLKNSLRVLGAKAPDAVRQILSDLDSRLYEIRLSGADPGQPLLEAAAASRTLTDAWRAAGETITHGAATEVNRFATQFAKAYPHIADDLNPNSLGMLESLRPNEFQFGPLRAVQELYKNFRQKIPTTLKPDQVAALSVSHLRTAGRISDDVLRRMTDVDRVTTLEAAKLETADPKVQAELDRQIARYMGAPDDEVSIQGTFKIMSELDDILTELENPSMHTLRSGEVEALNDRRLLLQRKLGGREFLDEIDSYTLLQAQELGGLKEGAYGKIFGKLVGAKRMDKLRDVASMADELFHFGADRAMNWWMNRWNHGLHRMRTNYLYEYAANKLRIQIDNLQMAKEFVEADAARLAQTEVPEDLFKTLNDLHGQIPDLTATLDRLRTEQRSVLTTPAGKGVDMNNPNLELWRHVSPEETARLVRLNSTIFDPDVPGSFVDKGAQQAYRGPDLDYQLGLAKAHLHRLNGLFDNRAKIVTDPASTPLAELRQAQHNLDLAKEVGDADAVARAEQVMATTRRWAKIRAKREDTYWHREMRREIASTTAKVERLDSMKEFADYHNMPVDMRKFRAFVARELSPHRPMEALEKELQTISQVERSTKALAFLRANTYAIHGAAMPFYHKARMLHDIRVATAAKMATYSTQLDDLARYLNKLAPDERRILAAAQETGTAPTQLIEKDPILRAIWERAYPDGNATAARNLDDYFLTEHKVHHDLIRAMHEAGQIDTPYMDDLLRRHYNPHLYTIYERAPLLADPKLRDIRSAKKVTPQAKLGPPTDPFEFARDLDQWRVRVAEKDGKIHDELFEKEELARGFVRRKFGDSAANSLSQVDGEGFAAGRTAVGDPITLAKPIGERGKHFLGKIDERFTPEARLSRFSMVVKNLGVHAFLDSLQGTGLVIDEATFRRLSAGGANTIMDVDFAAQFVKLPKAKGLGNMGGKFAHKRVLAEMNSLSHNYDQLTTWLETVRDMFTEAAMDIPAEIMAKVPGKLSRAHRRFTNLVKAAQILFKPGTWFANMTWNIALNEFTGGRVLSAKNWDNLKIAIDEVFGGPKLPHQRSRLYNEAIEEGLLTGEIFDRGNIHLQRAKLRMTQLDDAPALRRDLDRLQSLEADLRAELESTKVVPKNIDRIQTEIAAVETALKGHSKNILRRAGRWFYAFVNKKTVFNMPPKRLMRFLKDSYGGIDDLFKFATYMNLRREGLSRAAAAGRIRAFMQNYANVPLSISSLSSSVMGSLVPAFPYELARITRNLIRYQPLKFMGFMGMLPFLNFASAATAGVPMDRMLGALEAMSSGSKFDMARNLATSLYLFDGRTHNVIGSVSIANLLSPYFQVFEAKGAMSQAIDHYFPEEDRTWTTEIAARLGKFAGNFVLNNPLMNSLAAMFSGKDPVTGKDLFRPENVSALDYGKAFMRVLGSSVVPPLTPGLGRDFTNIYEAYTGTTDPETGKPYGTMETTDAAMRALLNLPVRNLPNWLRNYDRLNGGKGDLVSDATMTKYLMYKASNLKGSLYGSLPLFGTDAEIRQLTARLKNEADPAEVSRLEGELKALLQKERSVTMAGMRVAESRTDQEAVAFMEELKKRGIADHFGRLSPVQQATVLRGLAQWNARPDTLWELIRAALFDNGTQRWKLKDDPEVLAKAMAVIAEQLEKKPNPALQSYLNGLQMQQQRAVGPSTRKQIRLKTQPLEWNSSSK